MNEPGGGMRLLRVLCLEDSSADAELVRETLESAGLHCEMEVASDRPGFEALLARGPYDLILTDHTLPGFDAHGALRLAAAAWPSTPLICVSGTIGEEVAVELLKEGADDCVLKDRIWRLPSVVERAIETRAREQALRESEDRYREVLEYGGVGVAYFSLDGRVLLLNRRAVQNLGGGDAQAFLGKSVIELFGEDTGVTYLARFAEAAASPEPIEYTERVELPIGPRWLTSVHTRSLDACGAVVGVHVYAQDVTERKRAEEDLAAAAAAWRETFDAMSDSVAVFDAEGAVLRCNEATCTLVGRSFDDILGHPCYEVFHGMPEFHSDCPQLRARATGQAQTSVIEQAGRWLRVTFVPNLDVAGNVVGGVHVVTDVSDLKESERLLREALSATVEVVSHVVEMRDPYTSGHERRVSELAVRISEDMNQASEFIDELRVAALLHDVGKISVPIDILSKPGKLSDLEFELIKGHAEAGFRIISAAHMVGHAAEIVHQHHERCDGSGYPAGLVADQLLLGSKVLMVADVVEAMVTHRPYREALPLEAALAEIEQGSGTRYDAAVCEITLRLFREKGFAFVG